MVWTTISSHEAKRASAPPSWAATCSARFEQAFEAADGEDVRVGGGPSTIQQYLRSGLIDEMHLAFVPILLGGGERLFDHLDGGPDGYECVEFVSSPSMAHARFTRKAK